MRNRNHTVEVNGRKVTVGDLVGFKFDTAQTANIEKIHVNPWDGKVSFTVSGLTWIDDNFKMQSGPRVVWATDCLFN